MKSQPGFAIWFVVKKSLVVENPDIKIGYHSILESKDVPGYLYPEFETETDYFFEADIIQKGENFSFSIRIPGSLNQEFYIYLEVIGQVIITPCVVEGADSIQSIGGHVLFLLSINPNNKNLYVNGVDYKFEQIESFQSDCQNFQLTQIKKSNFTDSLITTILT